MRDFTVRSGKFAGTHFIYDNEAEATEHNIVFKKPWYGDSVEAGDWVVADDGYVIQCLFKRKIVNKRHRSGQYTMSFRFCNGTFYYYVNRVGKKNVVNFYAVATKSHKNSMGDTPRIGKYLTSRKKEFVTLIATGLDLYSAYVKAYQVKTISRNGILIQINRLMDDPIVREELMEQMQPFIRQVEASIKEKTGANSLVSFLVDEISDLISDPKSKIPKERRENIKLLVNMFGEQLGIALRKKTSKEIEEADYEIVKPPELGQPTN